MSESLKDQLLALGIAKPKKPSKSKNKRHRKPAKGKGSGDVSLAEAYKQRSISEKQAAEQSKARKLAEEKKRREVNKQLKELVKEHALNDEKADVGRNFLFKGRIRKILLTQGQLTDLNAGELGIVYLAGRYFLLPSEQVEAVKTISPDHVPDLSGNQDPAEEEFPVPDDMVW